MIKEAYLPIAQHRGNWYINQLYYQVSFFGNDGFINPPSANMISRNVTVGDKHWEEGEFWLQLDGWFNNITTIEWHVGW